MQKINLAIHPLLKRFIILILLISTQTGLSKELNTEDNNLTPVIVLDFEMLGDTEVEHLKQNDAVLMKKFSKVFREQLKQQTVFDVIDDKKSMTLIEQQGKQQFLHRCNGCELDLGKQLGAKQIVVPWIFRTSILIQTLIIEIRDVETGRLILKSPYNFRGNTDKAWEKTILYAISDLKKTLRKDDQGALRRQYHLDKLTPDLIDTSAHLVL
jgi:Tol biopolymer transport system component